MMTKVRIFYLVLMLIFIISAPTFAEVTDFQVGARPIGMGGAFVGLADDANAAYWNPAGLVNVDGLSITTMHANMFGMSDLVLNYYAIAIPIDKFAFGLNMIEEKAILPVYDQSENKYSIHRYGVSCAYLPIDCLALGTTINQYNYSSSIGNKNGFAIDLAALYIGENYQIGGVARNVMSKIPEENLETMFQFGISYDVSSHPLTLVTDLSFKKDISDLTKYKLGYHLGCEYTLVDQLKLRVGYNNSNLTGGFGYNYNSFKFDYACMMHELGLTHRISGGLEF